jgi:hypothetical protein
LREIAAVRRRFGYRRLHILLQREGLTANHRNCEASTPRDGPRFAVAAGASGRSAPGHR